MFRRELLVFSMFLTLAACVPVPADMQAPIQSTEIQKDVFPGLDPGGQESQTLHFVVRAYGIEKARSIAEAAEADYQRIMQATGLYSFRSGGTYELVVYATAEEYRQKSQMPQWSGGATVGNAIYSYEGSHLRPTVAHEMSHLIFNEFMGRPRSDLRWLNEGLAVYQESLSSTDQQKRGWDARMDDAKRQPMPFAQMSSATPLTEQDKNVSRWYQQVASVVRHTVERGGRMGFETLLKQLKDGQTMDAAMAVAFPGQWTTLAALETDWRGGR